MKHSASIYEKQHPKIRQILDEAGSPSRTHCVALDYAKSKHVALFCHGFGEVLKKPFPVDNSPQGLEQLLQEVRRTCSPRGIQPQHVFFGGEDSPAYVRNFTHRLAAKGYLVARVHAWEAKHQRDNHRASTDEIDVRAMAKTLLTKTAYTEADRSDTVRSMREISRTRAYFVALLTRQKLQIHHYVERLCPGFLNEKKSGLAAFGHPSLALLAQDFSGQKLRQWRRDRLVGFLQRHGQYKPAAAAEQLKRLAGGQSSLTQHVLQCQSLQQSIGALEKELALALVQTSGALLTSLSGIGVVLASGILGELGQSTDWRALKSLSSYGGIVPRSQQTGGPDKPAQTDKVQRRCNLRQKLDRPSGR